MIPRGSDENAILDHIEWHATIDELISGFEEDKPIAELYNVIYMTNRRWKSSIALNEYDFAKVHSRNIATKI